MIWFLGFSNAFGDGFECFVLSQERETAWFNAARSSRGERVTSVVYDSCKCYAAHPPAVTVDCCLLYQRGRWIEIREQRGVVFSLDVLYNENGEKNERTERI